MRMIRRLLTALFPPTKAKRLVGVDHLGNKYYEQEKADGKMRRFFERSDGLNPDEYQPGMIPNLWETWIRGRTDTPPTVEDLLQREKMQEVIAMKAEEIKRRDDEAQEKAFEEGLISRSLEAPKPDMAVKQIGHASAPYFGPTTQDSDPTTVGGKFEPGAWKPQSRTTNEIDDGEEHTFQPQSWTPNKSKS